MIRIILGLLLISFSATSFAATEKLCFWMRGDYGQKGDWLSIDLTQRSITMTAPDDMPLAGKFPRMTGHEVTGKDGITYLNYDGGNSDCGIEILVDEALLKEGTKGRLKVRCRGEGYSEQVYFCRDSND